MVKIALYCPNKPLDHPHPSGDLVIARSIRAALLLRGHECREMIRFRARWFWTSGRGWMEAATALIRAYRRAAIFRPRLWLTYHTYYKAPDVVGPYVSRMLGIPYFLFQPMYATQRRRAPHTRTGFYLNRIALKSARHAFINNIQDMEALQRIIPKKEITHLPPGIFPEEFRRDEAAGRQVREEYAIPPDARVVMTAARFRMDVKLDSLFYLLDALRIVIARNPEIRLTLLMVGDGPGEERLRERAEQALPGRVIFTGGIPRSRMYRWYSAADLFVFPGIGESLGMVFLEAQACSLPVVALNTGGIPQVVRSGITGLLVPEDDGSAMAEAVEDLLASPRLRTWMGSEGRRFIERERNLHLNYRLLARKLESLASE